MPRRRGREAAAAALQGHLTRVCAFKAAEQPTAGGWAEGGAGPSSAEAPRPRPAFSSAAAALASKRGTEAALCVIWRAVLADFAALRPGGPALGVAFDAAAPSPDGLPRVAAREGDGDGASAAFDPLAPVAALHTELTRAYWPFGWAEGGAPGGGFASAARWVCGAGAAGETAEAEAARRTAEHRLARGVFTSTGAGDVRRAILVAERSILLATATKERTGDDAPLALALRDHAALLAHAGDVGRAREQLRAHAATGAAREARRAAATAGPAAGGASDELLLEAALAERLDELVGAAVAADGDFVARVWAQQADALPWTP
eukprot:PRCOL_00006348-RA